MFYRTKSNPYALLFHALSEQSTKTESVTTSINDSSNYLNGEVHKSAHHLLTKAYKDKKLTKGVDVRK